MVTDDKNKQVKHCDSFLEINLTVFPTVAVPIPWRHVMPLPEHQCLTFPEHPHVLFLLCFSVLIFFLLQMDTEIMNSEQNLAWQMERSTRGRNKAGQGVRRAQCLGERVLNLLLRSSFLVNFLCQEQSLGHHKSQPPPQWPWETLPVANRWQQRSSSVISVWNGPLHY